MPYVYTLNLKGGKKYVGYTNNLNKRIDNHFNGYGAKVTQQYKPISVNNIKKCRNIHTAKKCETYTYYDMKQKYGKNNVKGAGNTSRFKK